METNLGRFIKMTLTLPSAEQVARECSEDTHQVLATRPHIYAKHAVFNEMCDVLDAETFSKLTHAYYVAFMRGILEMYEEARIARLD